MISTKNSRFALDASAVLALLQNEPGHENVRQVLNNAWIHSVNAAEVIGKLVRSGTPKYLAGTVIRDLQLEVEEKFSSEEAEACGILLAENRSEGLSLGDCVCLTAAAWHGAEAVTTERLWKKLHGRKLGAVQMRIRLIR
jgi:ribonuclease VapC